MAANMEKMTKSVPAPIARSPAMDPIFESRDTASDGQTVGTHSSTA